MSLDLLLFTTRPAVATRALEGGCGGIVVDWERVGKEQRQGGTDTLISGDTPADLARIRNAVSELVICRLDPIGPWSPDQVALALGLGADELLLPMIRHPDEVERALDIVRGRCGVGMLVETVAAVRGARAFAHFPLTRVYVGLNDLAIERGSRSIFEALADGTVESLREVFADVPFGFGGLTVPGCGFPIPTTLLLGELLRLDADFTFLRRSFWEAVSGLDAADAVARIRRAAEIVAGRDARAVSRDRAALLASIEASLVRTATAARPR